jgi:hypothetical protein
MNWVLLFQHPVFAILVTLVYFAWAMCTYHLATDEWNTTILLAALIVSLPCALCLTVLWLWTWVPAVFFCSECR